jgi:hypothetical protein
MLGYSAFLGRFGRFSLKTLVVQTVIAIPTCREWQSHRHRLGKKLFPRLAMLRERLLRLSAIATRLAMTLQLQAFWAFFA